MIPYGPAWGCKGLSITQSVPTSLYELGQNNPGSNCKPASPIIIDAYGEGFHLTDVAHGVLFHESLKLPAVHLSWTDPKYRNGWLALPHDGSVRALSDLFGDFTAQPPSNDPNGFRALGVYDDNHDDVIDAQDAIYEQLRIWIDDNHDGVSQPGELHTLAELGSCRSRSKTIFLGRRTSTAISSGTSLQSRMKPARRITASMA